MAINHPKVGVREWEALRERSSRAADSLLDWLEGYVGPGYGVHTAEITDGTLVVEAISRDTVESSSMTFPLDGASPPVWP